MRRTSTALILTIAAITMLAGTGRGIVRRQKTDSSSAAAAGTGMIVTVSGVVSVSGRREQARAYEGLPLASGDSLTLGDGAEVNGFRPSGEPFQARGPATLAMSADESQFGNRIHDWTAEHIASWHGLHAVDAFALPARHEWEAVKVVPSPMIPADGGSVRPGAARFWWKTIDGVDRYELEISWEDGRTKYLRKTVRGGNLLTIDELEPGREYRWRVRTKEGSKVVSGANAFRVLTVEDNTILEDITYGLPDIMAGALLLTAGLHEEAIARFDNAVGVASQRYSALVWRSRALAAAGRYEEAYRDLVDSMIDAPGETDAVNETFLYDGLLPARGQH